MAERSEVRVSLERSESIDRSEAYDRREYAIQYSTMRSIAPRERSDITGCQSMYTVWECLTVGVSNSSLDLFAKFIYHFSFMPFLFIRLLVLTAQNIRIFSSTVNKILLSHTVQYWTVQFLLFTMVMDEFEDKIGAVSIDFQITGH